jgi:hypothetical protein
VAEVDCMLVVVARLELKALVVFAVAMLDLKLN